jgi:ferric-dicitrate binding protein FerR (iron transport regulator)
MDEHTRDALLVKFKQGTLSLEENQQLLEWVNSSPLNQQLFEDTRKVWQMSIDPAADVDFNTEREWEKLSSQVGLAPFHKATKQHPPTEVRHLNPWLWRSIAAAITLLLAAYLAVYQPWSSNNQQVLVTKSTANQVKQRYRLTDGSIVWLNENSTIRYPEKFSSSTREVYLTGEAFFEVAEDPYKPFIIHGHHTITQVVGTSFNLRTKPEEAIVELTVVSGKVRFFRENAPQKQVILTAGMKGLYQPGLDSLYLIENTNANFRAWQDNRLIFDNTPLKEILPIVEKHYKTSIKPDNPAILNCRFTSTFEKARLEEILQAITLSLDLHYHYDGKKYILSGDGC